MKNFSSIDTFLNIFLDSGSFQDHSVRVVELDLTLLQCYEDKNRLCYLKKSR